MAEPILKWAGGKRQLLDELYQRFPASYENGPNAFHEPFFGSGALFFDHEPSEATINDLNPRLHNFYIQVRDHPNELIARVRQFNEPESDPDPTEEFAKTDRKGREISNYYYQQRALFNRRPNNEPFDPLDEAARLLYLNRTCFNGLYRENSEGGFNVPMGDYSNPDWVRAEQIRRGSELLQQLDIGDIHNDEFDYVEEIAIPGDVVYFDPPYVPLSPTANFAEYSAEGFGQDEQEALLETAITLRDREVWVILSNSGVMFDFYDEAGFFVETEGATRSINSDAENRGEVDEIIATNVPPDERMPSKETTLTEFSN